MADWDVATDVDVDVVTGGAEVIALAHCEPTHDRLRDESADRSAWVINRANTPIKLTSRTVERGDRRMCGGNSNTRTNATHHERDAARRRMMNGVYGRPGGSPLPRLCRSFRLSFPSHV